MAALELELEQKRHLEHEREAFYASMVQSHLVWHPAGPSDRGC